MQDSKARSSAPLLTPKRRTTEASMSPSWISLPLKTNTPVIFPRKALTMQGGRYSRQNRSIPSKQYLNLNTRACLKHGTPKARRRGARVPTVHEQGGPGHATLSDHRAFGLGKPRPCTWDPARATTGTQPPLSLTPRVLHSLHGSAVQLESGREKVLS